MNNVTEQLRRVATRSGLSINALAKDAGLSYAIVYDFLKKDRAITINSVAKLCAALGLELRPIRRGKRKG